MQRHVITPRPQWQTHVEALGCNFHTINGNIYWDESACYAFTTEEIELLEDATNTLEHMCLQAVDYIIVNQLFDFLHITPMAAEFITHSWQNKQKHLYGRFDLAYDGHNSPKLLEYNADTPTSLLEASVIQWQWLAETMPDKDQFNSIHEHLVASWPKMCPHNFVTFACVTESPEDYANTLYLAETAAQAGLKTQLIDMVDIGLDGTRFVDLNNHVIDTLFKLYPWEWLWHEEFAPHIAPSQMQIIEPAWKMLLSNKGLLPILWQMFPQHPYLLEASFDENHFRHNVVKKPLYGREGNNVTMHTPQEHVATQGPYGAEGFVYQQYYALPQFAGNYPVIGSWVIDSQAAGMGIREDTSRITKDTARFVPHYFL